VQSWLLDHPKQKEISQAAPVRKQIWMDLKVTFNSNRCNKKKKKKKKKKKRNKKKKLCKDDGIRKNFADKKHQ
jgi:hypothetical protein